jgi:D-tyrosyl-tRNA(Tyr) deacylase
MRALLQRVSRASVEVEGRVVGRIDEGLLALVCALDGDGDSDADWIADRIASYRVFEDERGRMNRSLLDAGGAVLVVSQFTLAADGRKGRRPSFDAAAEPALAEVLCERVARRLAAHGLGVETGRFGARMRVELVNEGPATFFLESPTGRP